MVGFVLRTGNLIEAGMKLFILFLCFAAATANYSIASPQWTQLPPECYVQKSRIPWILDQRQPDFGWKEHTHRGNIALAVNRYKDKDQEQMKQQLKVEVVKALMRNNESPIHDNDLALYIHALIASNINPRNFHGIDLVADLRQRVDAASNPHPFLVLALCNSHAVTFDDLSKLRRMATLHQNTETRKELEMKALALKAFACEASLNNRQSKFQDDMLIAAQCLTAKQSSDGSFGNAYTTSLIVQALVAYGKSKPSWNQSAAFDFLLKESEIALNMIKAYYIEMALNSQDVKFIKDLYHGTLEGPESPVPAGYYIQYTLKAGVSPDIYFTATMKIHPNIDFFTIMKNLAAQTDKFRFSHYLNKDGEPMVYKMVDLPNDAEENMFWRMCVQRNDYSQFYSDHFNESPAKFMPQKDQHIIMWYRDSECPSADRTTGPFRPAE